MLLIQFQSVMSIELQTADQSFNLEFLVDKAGIFKITGRKGMSEGRHVVQDFCICSSSMK